MFTLIFSFQSPSEEIWAVLMFLFMISCKVIRGDRTISPWTIAPQTIVTWDNCLPNNFPQTIPTKDNCPLENYPQDNCSTPRQFPHKIIAPQTNTPQTIIPWVIPPRKTAPDNCTQKISKKRMIDPLDRWPLDISYLGDDTFPLE